MFASKTLSEHLVRGMVGLACVTAALIAWPFEAPGPVEIVGRAVAALAALALLRGCPMCWLYGLVETVVARARGREARGACIDGSCAGSHTGEGSLVDSPAQSRAVVVVVAPQ
ncbi:MAG: hypothetical protein U0414_19885 [Polyangiaceae bacterium]